MYFKSLSIMFCLGLIWLNTSCSGTKNAQAEQAKAQVPTQPMGPKMTFDKTHIDFGKVKKGEKREATYSFTNTGDEPLTIEIATTCHCTTMDYPRNISIAPGEGGQFDIIFDSSEKDKSEQVDITIVLVNTDKNGYPIIEELFFKFDLVE